MKKNAIAVSVFLAVSYLLIFMGARADDIDQCGKYGYSYHATSLSLEGFCATESENVTIVVAVDTLKSRPRLRRQKV